MYLFLRNHDHNRVVRVRIRAFYCASSRGSLPWYE